MGAKAVEGKLEIEDVPKPFIGCVDCCCVRGGGFDVVEEEGTSGLAAGEDVALPGVRKDEEKLMVDVLCSHLCPIDLLGKGTVLFYVDRDPQSQSEYMQTKSQAAAAVAKHIRCHFTAQTISTTSPGTTEHVPRIH